ncbi:MAG TPA: glycosyltransferase family 4 protein [Niallia sp.]|nr:glycosyltransferase family 4 protein [Niallia sp.]
MKKKILFCATVDYHFKAFHLPYMKWFKEQGWIVDVVASGDMDLPYVDKKYCLPIQRSPFHLKNIKALLELGNIIDQNSYDIVHCHTPMGGVLGRLASQKARRKNTKVIYTAHGFHFCKGTPKKNWLIYYPIERFLSSFTDCLITINDEDYKIAKTRFKAKRITHVHGVGVNTDQFESLSETNKSLLKKSFGYNPNDFLLFYAAEFNKNKNQQLLLQSLDLLKEKVPNTKLLLAGNGPLLENCREMASDLGITHMVDFLGFLNDVKEILPICDVAVGSSLREGLPVNIMEAMACGLPIVASKNRGHSELVVDGDNGFVVDPGNTKLFSAKILELYQSKELRTAMGKKSMERVKLYSLYEVKKEMIEIYSKYMMEDERSTTSQRTYI